MDTQAISRVGSNIIHPLKSPAPELLALEKGLHLNASGTYEYCKMDVDPLFKISNQGQRDSATE